MESEKQGLVFVRTNSVTVRIGLIFFIICVAVLTWFGISWQLGNMLADVTQPSEANAASLSSTAVSLSSRDPLTNWLKASVEQSKSPKAISGFETVVRLSPYDYRWWGQLGRAYEQADEEKKAEVAHQRAAELGPNYVVPQWQLGNFLLRLGKGDEALKAFYKVVSLEPVYRDQVFSIVWDYYDGDHKKLEALADGRPYVIAGLAKFYAAKGLPDKCLEAWNRLDEKSKSENFKIAGLIAQALYDKGFLATSVKFVDQLGREKGARVGEFLNGGFEEEILNPENVLFSWKVSKAEGMRVQTNSFRKHGGRRSLEISFSGYRKPDINNIYQTIAVESGSSYRLSFWIKTEGLTSAGLPIIQVVNASDSKPIAASPAFPSGTKEWQEYVFNFLVPDNSEGIAVRTSREYCGESCAITGSFWYDDFQLKEIE
jgi:tetratricopeptide (TPR) repeat protein